MKKITLYFQARGFKVVTVFGDGEFEHLKDLMRGELQINLKHAQLIHTCPEPKVQLDL